MKEWQKVLGIFILLGSALVLVLFIWTRSIDERFEKSSRSLDSLKREDNYQKFVDSLTRERNKQQLEDYLKKHPEDRPRKR